MAIKMFALIKNKGIVSVGLCAIPVCRPHSASTLYWVGSPFVILVMTCLSDVAMVYSSKRLLSGIISALIQDDTCDHVYILLGMEDSRRYTVIISRNSYLDILWMGITSRQHHTTRHITPECRSTHPKDFFNEIIISESTSRFFELTTKDTGPKSHKPGVRLTLCSPPTLMKRGGVG